MKIIVPISSFLLALTVYFLAGIQGCIHQVIVKLLAIDAVNDPLNSDLVRINGQLSFLTIMTAMVSAALAVVSITNKFCHRIIGVIVLIISILSVLLSLIIRFM